MGRIGSGYILTSKGIFVLVYIFGTKNIKTKLKGITLRIEKIYYEFFISPSYTSSLLAKVGCVVIDEFFEIIKKIKTKRPALSGLFYLIKY